MAQLFIDPNLPVPPNPAALRPRQGIEALIPTFRIPTITPPAKDEYKPALEQFYDFLKSNVTDPGLESLMRAFRERPATNREFRPAIGRLTYFIKDKITDPMLGPVRDYLNMDRRAYFADLENRKAHQQYDASRRAGAALPPTSILPSPSAEEIEERNILAHQEFDSSRRASEAGRTPPIVPPSNQSPNIVWNGERPMLPGGIAGWWQRMSQQPGFKRGLAAFGKSMAESRPGFLGALNAATHGIANAQDVMEASRLGERELALKEALANAQIGHYQAQAANYRNQVLQDERDYQEKLSDNERQARTTALNNAIQISKDNPLLAEKINILVQQGYLNEDGALVDSSPETVAAIAASLGDTYLNIAKKLEPYISSKEAPKPAASSPAPQGRRIAVIPGSTR